MVPGGDLAKVMRACCMISNSTAAWKETTRNRNLSYQQKTAGEIKTTAATLGMFVVKCVFFGNGKKRGNNIFHEMSPWSQNIDLHPFGWHVKWRYNMVLSLKQHHFSPFRIFCRLEDVEITCRGGGFNYSFVLLSSQPLREMIHFDLYSFFGSVGLWGQNITKPKVVQILHHQRLKKQLQLKIKPWGHRRGLQSYWPQVRSHVSWIYRRSAMEP